MTRIYSHCSSRVQSSGYSGICTYRTCTHTGTVKHSIYSRLRTRSETGAGVQGAGLRIATQIQLLVSNKRVDLIIKIYISIEKNNIHLMYFIIVPDHGRPSISGPIRSIKMYSWAQCTMQERLVCSENVPCVAQEEQGFGPFHPEHLPPLPIYLG